MHHKLQSSSSKNDGKKSVGRNQKTKPNRQTLRERATGDRSRKTRSRQNGRGDSKRSAASSTRDSRNREPKPGRGRSPVRDFVRCEVPQSAGFDPTGERALPCG